MLCAVQVNEFVQPFAGVFFKEHSEFQSHHSFIVRYRMGEDLDLKTHTDDGKQYSCANTQTMWHTVGRLLVAHY